MFVMKEKNEIYNTRGCRNMTTVKLCGFISVLTHFYKVGTTELYTLNCGLLRVAVSYHA